jgi:hypothetical protein
MNPKHCNSCGALSICPPSTLDLQAPICCERCGATQGSWRSVESPPKTTRPSQPRPASDLRLSVRVRSLIRGRIVFNNRYMTLDCTLRDRSETGARLTFSAPVTVPDEFDLEIPLKGRRHRARVMWQTAESCGVRFLAG